jgi:hypothetical protein
VKQQEAVQVKFSPAFRAVGEVTPVDLLFRLECQNSMCFLFTLFSLIGPRLYRALSSLLLDPADSDSLRSPKYSSPR